MHALILLPFIQLPSTSTFITGARWGFVRHARDKCMLRVHRSMTEVFRNRIVMMVVTSATKALIMHSRKLHARTCLAHSEGKGGHGIRDTRWTQIDTRE
jgi:hypothetical protein